MKINGIDIGGGSGSSGSSGTSGTSGLNGSSGTSGLSGSSGTSGLSGSSGTSGTTTTFQYGSAQYSNATGGSPSAANATWVNINSGIAPSTVGTYSTSLTWTATNNRFTYNGSGTKTFLVSISFGGSTNSGGQVLRFSVRGASPSSPTTWARSNSAANSNYDATFTNIVRLSSGEYLEPVMYNESGTSTITVMSLNYTINSLD